jgi:aspartate/methionine/tyrosine aminotransferase
VELDFFERVIALAKKHDIFVVHDLAYADIVFDGWKAPSIMQVPGAKDIAVEFFTLSKSYNMAGWRIGFMVGNPTWWPRWRASRATTTTAPSRRCKWRPLPRWKAISNA